MYQPVIHNEVCLFVLSMAAKVLPTIDNSPGGALSTAY